MLLPEESENTPGSVQPPSLAEDSAKRRDHKPSDIEWGLPQTPGKLKLEGQDMLWANRLAAF